MKWISVGFVCATIRGEWTLEEELIRERGAIWQEANSASDRVLSVSKARALVAELKAKGQRVGLCHGSFDVLHSGHLRHLESAKSQCDRLVVSVLGDDFVSNSAGRLMVHERERAELLAGLRVVDIVVINQTSSATTMLAAICPNFFFKGQEYDRHSTEVHPNFLTDSTMAMQLGIKVKFTHEKINDSSRPLLMAPL